MRNNYEFLRPLLAFLQHFTRNPFFFFLLGGKLEKRFSSPSHSYTTILCIFFCLMFKASFLLIDFGCTFWKILIFRKPLRSIHGRFQTDRYTKLILKVVLQIHVKSIKSIKRKRN